MSDDMKLIMNKETRGNPCCGDRPSCPITIYNNCEDMINPDSVKP